MCLLRFENNLLTIASVRFASISNTTPLSKLSFAFVSLALPLLLGNAALLAHTVIIKLTRRQEGGIGEVEIEEIV
jgi:hypothetical protein